MSRELQRILRSGLLAFTLALSGCSGRAEHEQAAASRSQVVPTYGYEVVNAWPHDREAFTQGLIYLKGILLESTGLNGKSSLRKVTLETGRIRQQVSLPSEFFAEGMTELRGKLYQLTWQNQKGFVYDLETLEQQGEFAYTGEGWGLTTDGQSLIMSDGSNVLRFLDPVTFKVLRSIEVFDAAGEPLKRLNELEFIDGEIWANVWQTPYVVRVAPANGKLVGLVDFSGLLSPSDYTTGTDVLNGIAYDPAQHRVFVTGKNWPKIFEVRLQRR